MIQPLFVFSEWSLFIVRIVLGVILLAHGIPKLKNPEGTAQWLGSIGFKPARFWAWVAGIVEGVGGAFLIVGLLTQPVAFFVILQFVVIMLKIKKFQKFIDGYEFDLLIAATALLLLFGGGGTMSIDTALGILLY